jgi:hypothetical protein
MPRLDRLAVGVIGVDARPPQIVDDSPGRGGASLRPKYNVILLQISQSDTSAKFFYFFVRKILKFILAQISEKRPAWQLYTHFLFYSVVSFCGEGVVYFGESKKMIYFFCRDVLVLNLKRSLYS